MGVRRRVCVIEREKESESDYNKSLYTVQQLQKERGSAKEGVEDKRKTESVSLKPSLTHKYTHTHT